jgi:hypothetical protein
LPLVERINKGLAEVKSDLMILPVLLKQSKTWQDYTRSDTAVIFPVLRIINGPLELCQRIHLSQDKACIFPRCLGSKRRPQCKDGLKASEVYNKQLNKI